MDKPLLIHWHYYKCIFICIFELNSNIHYYSEYDEFGVLPRQWHKRKGDDAEDFIINHIKDKSKLVSIDYILQHQDKVMVDVIKEKIYKIRNKKINKIIYGK